MEFLILGAILGVLPAWLAHRKGHSFLAWWIFGALLFIVALPMAIIVKADSRSLEARGLASGMRKCPHCAELVKGDAKVCRYCGREIGTGAAALT